LQQKEKLWNWLIISEKLLNSKYMRLLLILLSIFLTQISIAQISYKIVFKTKNYKADSVFISYNYGKDLFVYDTLWRQGNEDFILKSDKTIPAGMYYIGTFSQRKLFPVIISDKDTLFNMSLDFANKYNYHVSGSKENQLFRDYYLRSAESYRNERIYSRNRNYVKRDSVIMKLNALRKKYISENPGTIAGLVIKSEIEWIDPVFTDVKGIDKRNNILDYKIQHFLDNLELDNPVTLRLPYSHQEINNYFERVVHLKPEKVIPVLDSVFLQMGYNNETFKYYLRFFEKKYSFAFRPWVDKVYIHIAKKYYNKYISPWLTDKEIDLIQYKAKRKELSMPGKIIPDVTLVDKNDNPVRLLDIDADYMVLIFWRPGCSHCRHAMPLIRKFQKKFKGKGVKIVTACTRQRSDTYRCWDGIKSEKMEEFDYNLADKSGETGFLRKYNIGGVPNIFIIDKNKKILDKKVNPTLLEKRFEEILQMK
jgi:thiol-disulfide isomerase/thioredoxin